MEANPILETALERLDSATDDLVLDLSAVRRIDPAALHTFEQLGAKAREKSVRILVRGVDVHVYKVLKLVKLANDFSFLT